jgi:16S rRNA A1518/A1519 N6-dimethyltransferase RsmA/KsgA/DIM1 with predicted DNA glycosylase/AP lyase activity
VPASGQAGQSGRTGRTWGWHRLADEWAARVVAAAAVGPGELVLDIGAGTGALTGPLVRAGARVVAVELHPRVSTPPFSSSAAASRKLPLAAAASRKRPLAALVGRAAL